ncbi:MAG: hypothetical protein Q4B04_01445 [bacterium]|nr:hypothetical protein [bacterium]
MIKKLKRLPKILVFIAAGCVLGVVFKNFVLWLAVALAVGIALELIKGKGNDR